MGFKRIKMLAPKENEMQGSCVDKTDAGIYSVIELIPFISSNGIFFLPLHVLLQVVRV